MLNSICVFCGSNPGVNPIYAQKARELGHLLAKRNTTLVYGGGNVGLMGIIADATLEKGGTVIGVIPEFLMQKEVGHPGITYMHIVQTMHERKQKMADLSDAFIAMPGGMGTLEEMCEILTWSQLGLHQKPFGLLNVQGYYELLTQVFDHMVEERFLHIENRNMVLSEAQPQQLIEALEQYQPPSVEKWLDRSKT